MKKTLLLSILLFSTFIFNSLHAQNIKIIEGAEIKSKMSIIQIVGDFEGQLVTVFYAKKKYFLRSYNRNLEISSISELSLEYKGKELDFGTVLKVKNKLFIVTLFHNKKTNKSFLLYQEVNTNTLSLIGKMKILGEIPYKSSYDKGDFSILFSQNEERILIYHLLPYNKGGRQKISFTVLDSNLQKIWNKDLTLPYADKLFEVNDYEIDNAGNVYIVGKQYKGKKKSVVNGEINFNFVILGYLNNGEDEREYQMKERDKYITDIRLAIDNNLNLICAGFYNSSLSYSSLGGSFLLKMDNETGEMITSAYHKFEIDFITSLLSEKKKEKAKKKAKKKKKKGEEVEMNHYDLKNLIIRDDGGVLLVGEYYYVQVVTHYHTNANGSSYTTTSYVYHYGNIIVVNFNPDGSVDWMKRIPKQQSSSSPYYLSYTSAVFNDHIFFVYNDNMKNAKVENESEFFSYSPRVKDSQLVSYSINSEGETAYVPLFNAMKTQTLPVPRASRQLYDSNALIIFSKSKKLQRIFRLEFE